MELDTLSHAAAQISGMKVIWLCRYKDGTYFSQFQDGQERSTDHIDRANLHSISLLDRTGRVLVTQEFKTGQYPFYRRRTAKRANETVQVIHILGWREFGEADKEIRHVLFLYESDLHIECGDFRQPGEPVRKEEWRYPIQYTDVDNVPVQ